MPYPRPVRIVGVILLWTVTILMAFNLGEHGLDKFQNAEGWQYWFAEVWRYPTWFRAFIGTAELGGAILLLWPRTASYAALGLIVIMLGAFWTVTTKQSDLSSFDPVFNALLLGIVVMGRWKHRWGGSASANVGSA